MTQRFDVIVVGAGHAGIEAALASARLGANTLCVTLRLDRIGHLPCNCSIGGPAKGHIAREIDALGGQMALTTDLALTHIRRVGTGKGPAVQTLRAHVCKALYPTQMQRALQAQPNLTLLEGTADWVLGEDAVSGLRVLPVGASKPVDVAARAVVLTSGTFLNGLCHEGSRQTVAARHGDKAVFGLSVFLKDRGVRLRRFKTGTTPRVRLSSLKLKGLDVLESEPDTGAISFLNDRPNPAGEPYACWQTRTNPTTHDLLRERLNESAMYSGRIEGVGPRYCPSVEDKVVKFADKDSHPIFLEIEEWNGESVYVQGFSTSLPAETQTLALRTIPGLESVEVLRPGYAVEYDMADPLQLTPHLMSTQMKGLFLAGQLNGTSGYEEAAGQGIVAGINAAHLALDREPASFPRSESFIGVMVDDLVTKGVEDPYRMLTARAEHRLLLRHDNADQRLTPLARQIGLCSEERWQRFSCKMEAIESGLQWLRDTAVGAADNERLRQVGLAPVDNRTSLFDLLKRPKFGWASLTVLAASLDGDRQSACEGFSQQVREQLELAAKYDGYIQIQQRVAERAMRLEELRIPEGFAYSELKGLSFETLEKLSRIRPATIGQASRVPGVRPSDVALLIGWLREKTPALR